MAVKQERPTDGTPQEACLPEAAAVPETKESAADNITPEPAQVAASPPSNDARIVLAIWAYVKSHWKEISFVAGSVITTMTGAIIWIIAYFATQEQVTRIECILSTNMSIQSLPLELTLIKFQLDETMLEAAKFEERIKTKYKPDDQRLYVKFTNERKRLEDRQDRAEKELETARARQLDCIKGSKTTEKKQS